MRMHGRRLVCSAALLLWVMGCALQGVPLPAWELPPPPLVEKPLVQPGALHRVRFDNGLEVLVLEDHRLPRVAFGVMLRRGAAIVAPARAGLAAFTSELMKRGAGSRDALELARAVDAIGAGLSADSGWSTTGVGVSGLSGDRDLLLEILADVVLRPRFDPAEAEKARAEQLGTLERAKDSPRTLVRWYAARAVYGGHRFGLPLQGTPESVSRLDARAAREFHRSIFVPGNAVLFAVGDLDAASWEHHAREAFGPERWPAADVPPEAPAPPDPAPPARTVVVVDRPDLVQAQIVVSHGGIERSDPVRIPADLVNKVLGGSGFASRLMQRVRSDEGLTYGVGSGFALRRQPGPFMVSTSTRVSEARRVVDLLLEELERIRARPPSADELGRAQSLAIGRFGLGLETSEAVLSSLVDLELHGLPANSLDTYRARVRAVDVAGAAEIARSLFHPERAAIVVLGPADALLPQLEGLGPVEVVQP